MYQKQSSAATAKQQSNETVSKIKAYREHLRTISNGLIDMAKKAGREKYSVNQLLRECYNLQDAELYSADEWKEKGAYICRGQHAYLFWGKPEVSSAGYRYCPVVFRFSRDQVRFHEDQR